MKYIKRKFILRILVIIVVASVLAGNEYFKINKDVGIKACVGIPNGKGNDHSNGVTVSHEVINENDKPSILQFCYYFRGTNRRMLYVNIDEKKVMKCIKGKAGVDNSAMISFIGDKNEMRITLSDEQYKEIIKQVKVLTKLNSPAEKIEHTTSGGMAIMFYYKNKYYDYEYYYYVLENNLKQLNQLTAEYMKLCDIMDGIIAKES